MTSRDSLHRLIDDLPETEIVRADPEVLALSLALFSSQRVFLLLWRDAFSPQ